MDIHESNSKVPVSKSEVQDPNTIKEKAVIQSQHASDKQAHAPISEIKIDQEDDKVRVIREKNEEKSSKIVESDTNSCVKCLIF